MPGFFSGTLVVLSELAFAAFIVILALQREHAIDQPSDESRGLGDIALLATIAGVIVLALSLGRLVYATIRYAYFPWGNDALLGRAPSTRWQYFWHNVPSVLPLLCWMLAPLIVYLALQKPSDAPELPAAHAVEKGS